MRYRKGKTDHDGDGRMGGSLPEYASLVERVARLEELLRCADPTRIAEELRKD